MNCPIEDASHLQFRKHPDWLVWKGSCLDWKALKAVIMSLMELEAALEDEPELPNFPWTALKAESGDTILAKMNADSCWGRPRAWVTAVAGLVENGTARQHAAIHIQAYLTGGRAAHLAEGTDLRCLFDTPCNDR
jgi:hypothetical protein